MGAAGAVALVALALSALALLRARRAEARADALAVRVAVLESPVTAAPRPVVDDAPATFVITGMGAHGAPAAEGPDARPVDGRLFADIVARESVVMAASWTHGLRRALSPASRNRIRFEVRQETRRATRQRRAETKQALREFRARERAGQGRDLGRDLNGDVGEDVA